jgi:uncharacterized caspase-like protein
VLYQALTGQAPFAAGACWSPPTDPRRITPELPRALASLVLALQTREAPAGAPRRRPLTGALAAVALLALAAWRLWPQSELESAPSRGLATSPTPAPGASHAPGFGRSCALLIGIGKAYEGSGWNPLTNAAGDVEALADALTARAGDRWEVRTLLDEEASHDGIKTALETLGQELGSEDRALIYFAGHGEPHPTSETSGWLIPADARRDDEGKTRWLHFDGLTRAMIDSPAKHVLLALDCCYGGRVAELRGSASALAYEQRFTTEPAQLVLAAGRADQPVADGSGAHSPFAAVLLEALSEAQQSFTTSDLHGRLQQSFLEQGLPQTPVLAHLPGVPAGEFVFLGR